MFQIPTFHDLHIIVVGDVMLDRYWTGKTGRISPEAPVPVVHISNDNAAPGGAANVALNLRALGCAVTLYGVVGDDTEGVHLQAMLEEKGVACCLHTLSGRPTTTKLRVLDRHQQLIRMDFEAPASTMPTLPLWEGYQAQLVRADAVVLSDYGRGVLNDCQPLIKAANKSRVPVLVDPKQNDFGVYRGATILKPNMKEFEAAVGMCADESEIEHKSAHVMATESIENIVLTRGEQGMALLRPKALRLDVPAKTRDVFDVTGAGDTTIAVLAASVAARVPLEDAVVLANTAAGIAVSKSGAASVTVSELRRALQRQQQDHGLGVLSEEDMLDVVLDARAQGETIVMTNGCFDLLHAGHVSYLQQAKRLGHRLIIAVNEDASVRRLKGQSRPLVPLAQRMAVLSALRCVDWVVSFSEETPERIIQAIVPDVLVKAADYEGKFIAGADFVSEHGGRVVLIPFVEGLSTTGLVKKIKEVTV